MQIRLGKLGIARAAVLALAIAALALLVASGPGTRGGLWPWQTGLAIFRWAAYLGIAAAVAATVLVAMLAVQRWRAHPWVPILALCIALAAVAPPLILLSQAKSLPRIHDVSTDLEEPPAFEALLDARRRAPNGAEHGGAAVAEAQRAAYADIVPLLLEAPPREVMQRALDAARAMGWEVVASDVATGRLEAIATTAFFGFRDDVVVRVRPHGTGSRVDVRSASRVGLSDIGANARRIREYLGRLA
jgi:uncharacterized protein (DUF1499 family)